MGELIEIRDMCKIYNPGENEVRALDHVDLRIDKNEFVALSFVVEYNNNKNRNSFCII